MTTPTKTILDLTSPSLREAAERGVSISTEPCNTATTMSDEQMYKLVSAVLNLQPRTYANDATRLWQMFASAEDGMVIVRQALDAAIPIQEARHDER